MAGIVSEFFVEIDIIIFWLLRRDVGIRPTAPGRFRRQAAFISVFLPEQLRSGLLAGLAFGIFAWVVFAALLASHGALWKAVEMSQIFAVSVAIPVVGAGLGSLVRGVV